MLDVCRSLESTLVSLLIVLWKHLDMTRPVILPQKSQLKCHQRTPINYCYVNRLILGCSTQCSGKGRCVNSTCICLEGWSGEDCRIGKECVMLYNISYIVFVHGVRVNALTVPISNFRYTGACGECVYGSCEAGFCQCVIGWEGPACDTKGIHYN